MLPSRMIHRSFLSSHYVRTGTRMPINRITCDMFRVCTVGYGISSSSELRPTLLISSVILSVHHFAGLPHSRCPLGFELEPQRFLTGFSQHNHTIGVLTLPLSQQFGLANTFPNILVSHTVKSISVNLKAIGLVQESVQQSTEAFVFP